MTEASQDKMLIIGVEQLQGFYDALFEVSGAQVLASRSEPVPLLLKDGFYLVTPTEAQRIFEELKRLDSQDGRSDRQINVQFALNRYYMPLLNTEWLQVSCLDYEPDSEFLRLYGYMSQFNVAFVFPGYERALTEKQQPSFFRLVALGAFYSSWTPEDLQRAKYAFARAGSLPFWIHFEPLSTFLGITRTTTANLSVEGFQVKEEYYYSINVLAATELYRCPDQLDLIAEHERIHGRLFARLKNLYPDLAEINGDILSLPRNRVRQAFARYLLRIHDSALSALARQKLTSWPEDIEALDWLHEAADRGYHLALKPHLADRYQEAARNFLAQLEQALTQLSTKEVQENLSLLAYFFRYASRVNLGPQASRMRAQVIERFPECVAELKMWEGLFELAFTTFQNDPDF